MLFAATFPERVDKLILLEGGLPLTAEADEAPAGLAQALRESRALRGKTGRTFAQREQAIAERAAGFSKVTPATAEVLARRSLREVPGGWQWHADQRLKAQSELRLTPEQVRAFARRVTAPVLLLFATESPFVDRPLYREFPSMFSAIEVDRVPGAHHCHLEGAEAAIAARIRGFLAAPA
jgi:pimeloyl-ACP methyl ester carboxylesterase